MPSSTVGITKDQYLRVWHLHFRCGRTSSRPLKSVVVGHRQHSNIALHAIKALHPCITVNMDLFSLSERSTYAAFARTKTNIYCSETFRDPRKFALGSHTHTHKLVSLSFHSLSLIFHCSHRSSVVRWRQQDLRRHYAQFPRIALRRLASLVTVC